LPLPDPPSPLLPRPEDSRAAILRAATDAFAQMGEAGARTDAIARAAGVNKALIHYYFGTKEALYGAVLSRVFQGLVQTLLDRLDGPGTPGERLLRHFLDHFDRLAASGTFARLLAHELLRARAGQPSRIPEIARICFGPLHAALCATCEAGMETGELRRTRPGSVMLALTGANVFYFMSTPFFREISGRDPRDPDLLAQQRVALLEHAGTVLFTDPERGRRLALELLSAPGPRAGTRGDPS